MADAPTSPSATLTAFTEPLHLGALLLLTVALTLGLGLQGLAVVAVLEILYLALVPRMIPYKRRVSLKHAGQLLEDRAAARIQRASRLSRDVRRRYQAIAETHQRLLAKEDALPVERQALDGLLDAALDLSLILQDHGEAEAAAPLTSLHEKAAANPEDTALVARLQARENAQAQAQAIDRKLSEVEATFETLKTQSAGQRSAQVDVEALNQEVDVALRTAREMAHLSTHTGSR